MEIKNNGCSTLTGVVIAVLLIATLALSGFIVYDKFIKEDEVVQNDNGNNGNNNPAVDEKVEKEENVKVVDALNYVDGYYKMFSVKLPRITSENENAQKLNKKMLDEVLARTYFAPISYTQDERMASKGFITDYNYAIKNNIIAIYIKASVPEGGSALPASGGGLFWYNYFYDIKNDKILGISDAVKSMGITDTDGATDYQNLNNGCSKVIIENEQPVVDYEDACV